MRVDGVLQRKGSEVATIGPDQTLLSAVAELGRRRIGALVVVGGDGSVAGIVSERNQPRLPRDLAALLLFDAINVKSGQLPSTSNELRAVTAWVRARLASDLAALQQASNAAARTTYLSNSPRLRGYFTPGHYANLYRPLETAINDWFRTQHGALQSLRSDVETALRANYSLTPVSSLVPSGQSPQHDQILALGNVLQNGLASLP